MDSFIEIIGKRYRVIYKKTPEKLGECDVKTSEISINPHQSEESKRDTLLHECIHAIDNEMQIKLSERQTRLTATGVMAWMRANPEYVAWIMQAPKPSRRSNGSK